MFCYPLLFIIFVQCMEIVCMPSCSCCCCYCYYCYYCYYCSFDFAFDSISYMRLTKISINFACKIDELVRPSER